MTFQELVQYMQDKLAGTVVDAKNFDGHAAYQFDISGDGAGAFYVEVKEDGTVDVQGYDYNDRDVLFACDSKVLMDIAEGKLDAEKAAKDGTLTFTGNAGKAVAFIGILSAAKKSAKKTAVKAEKKPAAKKAAAKTEKKPAAKAEKKATPAKAEKKAEASAKTEKKAETPAKAEKKSAETAAKAEKKTAAKTADKKTK